MDLYSYIVTHDTGFAPNPFWSYCTLACCKPVIRRKACVGDWIVGLSPKAKGYGIIYAMVVEEIISFEKYYHDGRFKIKRPDWNKGPVVYRRGDNIYKLLQNGSFEQIRSMHCSENIDDDLSGQNVLISKTFYYFGSQALELPGVLDTLKIGRGHRRFSQNFISEIDIISAYIQLISSQPAGVNAKPTIWPSDDESWKIINENHF
jgi:hypothetical protein